MFPLFPLLNKVIQKLKFTQEGEVILIAPGDRQNRGFHTCSISVWTNVTSFRTAGDSFMQHFQVAGFSEEVSRLTATPRRPLINRIYDDRWLRFGYWAAGQGIDLLGPAA